MQETVSHRTMIYENAKLTSFVNQVHHHMSHYGYQHAQVPAIAPADLFLAKAGDQIIMNLFTFDRFGQQLALRPEFTALAAHRYVQENHTQDIVRWQFNGSIFLEGHAQRHRDYQQISIGAELFGMANRPYANAEIATLALIGLRDVAGLDVVLQVGHVGLVQQILAQYQLDERVQQFALKELETFNGDATNAKTYILKRYDALMTNATSEASISTSSNAAADIQQNTHQMLDAMLNATQSGATMGGRQRSDIVRRLLKKQERAAQRQQLGDALDHLLAWQSHQGTSRDIADKLRDLLPSNADNAHKQFDQWTQSIALMQEMGVSEENIILKPGIIRDWNYYTGIVFELQTSEGTQLGGGGRYDELTELVGGKSVPAVGFAYYVDAVLAAMEVKHTTNTPFYTLEATQSDTSAALSWATELRQAGISVAVSIDQSTQQTPTEHTIHMNANEVTYAGQTYEPDQLSQLINKLKGDQ